MVCLKLIQIILFPEEFRMKMGLIFLKHRAVRSRQNYSFGVGNAVYFLTDTVKVLSSRFNFVSEVCLISEEGIKTRREGLLERELNREGLNRVVQ